VSRPGTPSATIVGAGGIGCALGHALAGGGVDLTVVERDPAKLEWGRTHGLVVDREEGRPVRLVAFDDWRPERDDPILLATKCYDNPEVLDRLAGNSLVVPIQNGFDAELRDRVVIEGIASFVSECEAGTTRTRITRPGDLHIGWCADGAGRALPRPVESLIDTLDRCASFTVRRVPEVLPYKNSKLMYNAAISPVAACAGLDNGELLTRAPARRLFFALLRENYRILRLAGAPLATIGPFHPDTVDRILALPLLARLMAVPFARSLRGTYCSMAGDLPDGPTELDNYNGHLLELAGDDDAPVNRAVHRIASRVERTGEQPSLGILDELLAEVR
jgi:2-dehydropantoate 2-reductase